MEQISKINIKPIEKDITPVIRQASTVTSITTQDQMTGATELLSLLNKKLDMVEAEENKVVKPIKEALKAEQDRWKPLKAMLKEGIDILRGSMSAYQTMMVKKQREEEAKIAARIGEGKGKIKMETGIKKLDAVERPEEKIVTDVGTAGFRTVQKLKIIDEKLIPREYMIVDEVKLKAALKGGVKVPGAELEEVQSVINRR